MRLVVATKQGVHTVRWIEGERSGRILASALESSNVTCATTIRNEAFVGTRAGEIFSSNDRGTSWRRLEAFEGDGAVTALTGLPVGSGMLLAGTEPAAVHVSRDGGGSWARLDGFNEITDQDRWRGFGDRVPHIGTIAVDSREPQRFYAGVKIGGAYRSDDGGASWRPIKDGINDEIRQIAADPRDPARIYAATGAGFYWSPDRGISWQATEGDAGERYVTGIVTAAAPGGGSLVFAMTAAGPPGTWHKRKGAEVKVFRSEDGGRTAEAVSVVATKNAFTTAITNPDNEDAAVVGTSHGSIYHVDRRDREWHQVLYGLPPIRTIVAV